MKNYIENFNITKTVLIAIALSSVLSISIACFILNEVIERYDEEMIKVMASDVYDDINNELLKAMIVSRTMSNDAFLRHNLSIETRVPFDREAEWITDYLSTMKNQLGYSAAFIATENSKRYWTVNGLQKILDPTRDLHDIWYQDFLNKNVEYAFNVDTDEAKNYALTIFVNARITNRDGKILGVCGVGVDVSSIQKILKLNEQSYNVKINLVNQSGLIQVDSKIENIEKTYLENLNYQRSEKFILNKIPSKRGSYIITKYIPDFDWYLVIQRDSDSRQNAFSNVILYISIASSFMLAILLTFIYSSLQKEQQQVEENATKHGIASHSGLYVSMHLIDLNKNLIHELSSNPNIKILRVNEGSHAKEQLVTAVKQMTAKESFGAMIEFINFATLNDRMKNKNAITQEFLSENYGWCKAYFMLVDNNSNGNLHQIVFAIELIDEEKRREEHLQNLAETDAMTGLKNRGSGEKIITEMIKDGTEGMFFLFDADKFKSINDNFGHDVGDKVIKAIAKCLKKNFRTSDVVMRLGGDEFAAYAVGVTEIEQGQVIIYRLFKMLEQTKIPELGDRKISLSVGAAIFNAEGNYNFTDIYKRADSATYQSKKIEGNFCTFADDYN